MDKKRGGTICTRCTQNTSSEHCTVLYILLYIDNMMSLTVKRRSKGRASKNEKNEIHDG